MALIVNLKTVDNLPGKADRLVVVTFRDNSQVSKLVKDAKSVAYIGEKFEWPVARDIEAHEKLEIAVYNRNKYLSNKLVGSITLILQQLVQSAELKVTEQLIDINNRAIETSITFEANYFSPDGQVGQWDNTAFDFPILEQWQENNQDDPEAYEERQMEDFALVDETASVSSAHTYRSHISSMDGEDTASQTAMVESMFSGRRVQRGMLEQELHKPRHFQICLNIIQAQQLAGLDIDPVVKVEVGNNVKFSNIKRSTNCPYFNEYFVFDYHEPPISMFDKVVTLTVYHAHGIPGRDVLKAGNLLAGRVIGLFKCDVGTVYCAPDHQYYHKWAVLVNPKELGEGPRGYLKCDISCIGRGDNVKTPRVDKDDDDIEGNLLLPAGVPMAREQAQYSISIYKAEDLPRMDTGIFASMKQVLTSEKTALLDAYCKVSFAGMTGKTTSKKSYNPEFKENLIFIDMFPPLCNRFKIMMYDEDPVKDDVIATHFIDLHQIMDQGHNGEGFLPTFGPSWVNFYGAVRDFKLIDKNNMLNKGVGEGVAYRGRALISIKTEMLGGNEAGQSKVVREKVRVSGKMAVAPKKEFILFCSIFEASMIHRQWRDKDIYFEISIGIHGNTLDGMAATSLFDDKETSTDDSDDDEKAQLINKRQRKQSQVDLPMKSTTDVARPLVGGDDYYYMDYQKDKPCVYIRSRFEDLRKREYHTNLLQRIVDSLSLGIDEVKEMIRLDQDYPDRRLRGVLDDLIQNCKDYLAKGDSLIIGAGAGKTKLDKGRNRLCKYHVDRILCRTLEIRKRISKNNIKERWKETREFLRRLRHLLKEPQPSFPDVFIWMICNKKRVAYYRLPAKDILSSTEPEMEGKYCGKLHDIFLQLPGVENDGKASWDIQAKLQLYMWFGLHNMNVRTKEYVRNLPAGYKKFKETPPPVITYEDQTEFQLRAHIFQARGLVGADDTGMSDPFARVIIGNQSKSTKIVKESLSPTWDETLVFDKVMINGSREEDFNDPPTILVEFFDYDKVGKPEFLGRTLVTPKVRLSGTPYEPPDWPPHLEWWDVFRGSSHSGEVLCSCELLQEVPDHLEKPPVITQDTKVTPIMKLPAVIKPALASFRIEILFWGVRELKRLNLLSVDRPRVDIECAGQILGSRMIANVSKNSNFDDPLKFFDVKLPENDFYWPPITIRCFDCRNFGFEPMVGSHTIRYIHKYKWLSPEEIKQQEIEKQRKSIVDAYKNGGSDNGKGGGAGGLLKTINLSGKLGGSLRSIPGALSSKSSKQGSLYHIPGTLQNPDATRTSTPVNGQAGNQADSKSLKSLSLSKQPSTLTVPAVTFQGVNPPAGDPAAVNGQQPPANGHLPTADGQMPAPDGQTPTPDGQVVPSNGQMPPGGPGQPPAGAPGQMSPDGAGVGLDQAYMPPPPPKLPDKGKKKQSKKEKIQDLDWWSKYYKAKEEMEKEYVELQKKKQKHGVVNYDFGVENMAKDDFDIEIEKDIQTEQEKKRKKEKGKKKKLTKAQKAKKAAGGIRYKVNDAFVKDEDDLIYETDATAEEERLRKEEIANIMIYPTELEAVPEFGGFTDKLLTFDLLRGKKMEEDDDDERISGKFKGNLCVYKTPEPGADKKLKLSESLPSSKPVQLLIRVYIVRCNDLHPMDLNGKADPYVKLILGKKEKIDKENRIKNELNPVFGRCYEMTASFPMDSILKLQIWDYDLASSDDLIGETVIDLENRFLTKHRATCGMTQEYEIFGYNTWRDSMRPTQILSKLCKQYKLKPPEYKTHVEQISVGGRVWTASDELENEYGELTPTNEHLALEALKHWNELPDVGCPLVPEHIETRALFCPDRPGVEQGKVEMWVDIFPKDIPIPPTPVDITPRQPIGYELRVIVWNTDEVKLDDCNIITGESSSDIMVKGYLKGMGEDDQATDVHYRSMTGEGNFNWRFVFPFEYLKAEEKVSYKRKEGLFSIDETEVKVPAKLTLSVWDADLVSADDFLGWLSIDLNRIPRPPKDPKRCNLIEPDSKLPIVNLFKNKKVHGWFAFQSKSEDPEEPGGLVGKAELELQLLTSEEAEKNPAGLGRSEPDPLPEPNRPDTSFLWFMNPLKTLKFIIWKNFKWKLLKILIVALLILFLSLFIYAAPGYTVKKIWGA